MAKQEPIVFNVTSIFGHESRLPLVNVTVGAKDFHVQMLPEDAIALAHNLMEAAECSKTDAFLITFLREVVQTEDAAIAGILDQFRQWREAYNGKPTLE